MKTLFYRDAAERVLWTGAQAALGVVTVEAFDIPVGWAVLFAAAVATAKAFVAKQIGDPDSASTDPQV